MVIFAKVKYYLYFCIDDVIVYRKFCQKLLEITLVRRVVVQHLLCHSFGVREILLFYFQGLAKTYGGNCSNYSRCFIYKYAKH